MKTLPLFNAPAVVDDRFRDALEGASTQDANALAQATDAYAAELVQQLRAFALSRGGAQAAAFSHALAATPLAAYKRRDFTQVMPTEIAWKIYDEVSLDDLAALSLVNRQSCMWSRERLTPLLLLAQRWRRLPARVRTLKFNDGRREGRHWGRDTHHAHPTRHDRYLLAHDGGVEVCERTGDALATQAFHEGDRHEGHAIATAWHPSGHAYAYVLHDGNDATLYVKEDDGQSSPPRAVFLGLRSVRQIAWSPSHPHKIAVSCDGCDLICDGDVLHAQHITAGSTRILPGSAAQHTRGRLLWNPTRPWLLTTQPDHGVHVMDCSGDEPRVLHACTDVRFSSRGNAAWHATRPIFAVVTEENIKVVNLEGEVPSVLTIRPFDLIRFRHSVSFHSLYLAWEPHGQDLLAAYCSDEVVIAHVRKDGYEKVSVAQVSDVNGRAMRWSPDGHVEVSYGDGELTRVNPEKPQNSAQ